MSAWPLLSIPCPHGGIVHFCSPPNSSQGYCIPPACNEGNSDYEEDDPTPGSTTPSNHGNTQSENCAQGGSWWTCPNKNPLINALKDCCAGTLCSDNCLQANITQVYRAFNSSDADFLFTLGFSTPSTTSSPNNGFTLSYTPAGVDQIASAAQSSAASISLPGSTPTATAAGQSTLGPTTPAPKSNTAAIAGGVAGGIVGLALLLALLAICCCRRINRPQRHMDEGKSPTWGPGNARSSQPGDAEQEEIKQGPSLTSPPLCPPPSSPAPLASALPPPPAYTPYRLHDNEVDRSHDMVQPSAGSPYLSHNLPSPKSPPSPPPLKTRLSQHSADRYSDRESVSPISSHFQHQPFDENGGGDSSIYSEVSSNELLHNHGLHS